MYNVQGSLEVRREYGEKRIQAGRQPHGSIRRDDKRLLVRMVDEDRVSRREALDASSDVQDVSHHRVPELYRETIATV